MKKLHNAQPSLLLLSRDVFRMKKAENPSGVHRG